MNTKKKLLLLFFGLLMTFLLPNYAMATTACTPLTSPLPSPMPAGAEYDGKKVTICHFPPGNPSNVHQISISINALATHVGRHGDTIWEDGKSCPRLPNECPPDPTPTYPTVNSQTTKNTLPIITGTIGTTPVTGDGSLSVSVNGTTYSCNYNERGNSGKMSPVTCAGISLAELNWTLTTTTAIPVGIYDVVATRAEIHGTGNNRTTTTTTDQTTNELTIIPSTCPTDQGFVNNVCVPLPVVTVNSQTTTLRTPTITGTVGNKGLDANEAFYVQIFGSSPSYSHLYTNLDGNLSVSGTNWTLNIPTASQLPTGAGVYEVHGSRDNGLPGTGTVTVLLTCPTGQELINGICTTQQTCTAPKTGTPPNCSCPTGTFNNATCDAIPSCVAPTPVYDSETNTCKAGAATPNPTVTTIDGQTYTSPTAVETKDTTPVISGTVGNTVLASGDTFSVTVNGVNYAKGNANLTAATGSANWSLAIPEADKLPLGTYEVNAVRNSVHDLTHNEFKVYIDICKNNADARKFDSEPLKSDETAGICEMVDCQKDANGNVINETEQCTVMPDETLPPSPDSLLDEKINVTPNEVQYCDDGSILSGSDQPVSVTIKRVRIANTTVKGGTFKDKTLWYEPAVGAEKGTKLTFGYKQSGTGIVTLEPYVFNGVTYTPEIKKGQITHAKIDGVTITNAYIDLLQDYIDAKGEVISASDGIAIEGGTTQIKTVKENGTEVYATITGGMIVSGTDANGNPMRGRITSGTISKTLENGVGVLTKGRRTRGTITNATIINARITTAKVNGVAKTVVDVVDRTPGNASEGLITAGTMDSNVVPETFGTVLNQTIEGSGDMQVGNTNTCFSSGSVGSKGQLNWKEIVR